MFPSLRSGTDRATGRGKGWGFPAVSVVERTAVNPWRRASGLLLALAALGSQVVGVPAAAGPTPEQLAENTPALAALGSQVVGVPAAAGPTPEQLAENTPVRIQSGGTVGADDKKEFEVWAIDQSNSPGVPFGGLLNIYDGHELVEDAGAAVPEVVDLAGASRDLCREHTGSDPVRPHSVLFNSSHSHAVIAFVASGHVLFMETATRAPVRCIQMSMGSDGVRQAHAAFPAPNDAYVLVANQGGKLLERINTDANNNGQAYENATDIVHDTAATLNLATCITPNGVACETPGVAPRPNNSLVGPMIDRNSALAFLTLSGGGLLVVDSRTGRAPPPIVAEYDNTAIQANGFGGMQKGAVTSDHIYLNSGAGGTNVSGADLYSLRLAAFPTAPAFNAPNSPAPTVVFSHDGPGHDSHGLLLLNPVGKRRFLWAADRPANAIEVVDTTKDTLVNSFSIVSEHSADPAPELFELSPGGSYAFVSLRGPCPVTGNVPGVNNAVGDTPGVGVLRIRRGGRSGTLLGIAPIDNVDGTIVSCSPSGAPASNNRGDVHGIAVRVLYEDEGARTPPPVDHDLERR